MKRDEDLIHTAFLRIARGMAVASTVLLASTSSVNAGDAPTAAVTKAAAPKVDRVKDFLKSLMNAKTAEESIRLFDNAKFSEAEMKSLEDELAKPEWANKLKQLETTAPRFKPSKSTPKAYEGKSAAQVLAIRKQAAADEHKTRLTASAPSKSLKTAPKTVLSAPAVRPKATKISAAVLPRSALGTTPDPGPPPSTIEEVRPPTPVVHGVFTIKGRGFGNTKGTLYFIVGEDLFEAEVTGWMSNTITAKVPHEVMPWEGIRDIPDGIAADRFGNITLACKVWIRLADGRWGGGREIGVGMDTRILESKITAVTPREVTPGATILIEGSNFGNSHGDYGGASLYFGSKQLPTEILRWRDNEIVLRVFDDISGELPMIGGHILVGNSRRKNVESGGMSFVPVMEVVELPWIGTFVSCRPRAVPLICWVGMKETFTRFDYDLNEGWTVDESWLELEPLGVNSGAYYERQPVRGDRDPESRIVVWADGLSNIKAIPHVTVKGPRGTTPR